ncbi:hypothetical protein [Neobacillus sp. DY30]|uniref:hypothetical protein n=1 Tax=Neobacillus sp. DY30 TaxID=3047871 RepID=UPI0024C0A1EB|nr:hypothetical protein [Neobacillus sp. DY30]WHY01110.1 hypothetical protein QNH29_02275 [Neobacillus sp. DY30]
MFEIISFDCFEIEDKIDQTELFKNNTNSYSEICINISCYCGIFIEVTGSLVEQTTTFIYIQNKKPQKGVNIFDYV